MSSWICVPRSTSTPRWVHQLAESHQGLEHLVVAWRTRGDKLPSTPPLLLANALLYQENQRVRGSQLPQLGGFLQEHDQVLVRSPNIKLKMTSFGQVSPVKPEIILWYYYGWLIGFRQDSTTEPPCPMTVSHVSTLTWFTGLSHATA